ncbi:MAG: beta-lactamase family protein [Flavobacteriales bacterium]|jgi:CubicO group peptidase (beta-lactamase class C family)|nr:beta-lactamase family protein [Flavobacteriales bacterium]
MNLTEKHLQSILDKLTDNKKVFGSSFAIKTPQYSWEGHAGNFSANQQYFIASTTKLFTTAIILNLKSQGKLDLNDKIQNYVKGDILNGLHTFKGADYSKNITIQELLAHTSGLPDYFQNKDQNGQSLEKELTNGSDQYWSFEQAIEKSKAMTPLFAPSTPKKAHYSDTNFQLLGHIIENITQKTYRECCNEYIIAPLALAHTYLYLDYEDQKPKTLYYKNKALAISKAMTSFGPDGGIVSTSSDMLIFIEAFFEGKLFPQTYINELQKWNRIFFPMRSGIGIHLFKLPWIFNPFGTLPYFIGHSGLSGALAFYSPQKQVYITGTVNQIAHPDLSFKTMIKLTQTLVKQKII